MAKEMKDSGIQWIGQVPEHWNIGRLKWNIIEINEKNDPIKMTNILSLTKDKGVLPYEDKGNQGNKAKEDLSQYKIAYKDTIVANSMNIIIGSVGISKYDGCVSPVYYVFKNKENSDLRFLNYLLTTTEFQKQLRRYANGILEIRLRISSENLMKQLIPIPDLLEQRKIADFLDKKIVEIDSVINKTKETIEDYKKYKQAVITEAVTKGLNPDVEMKDSGNKWIGNIPKKWNTVKVKTVSNRVTDGAHVSPELENGMYDFISTVNVEIDKINFENCLKTSERSYNQLVLNGCKPELNDVLISKDGSVGKTVVIDYEKEFVVASSLVIIRPKLDLIIPKFLSYNLQSKFVQDQLVMMMHGSALKRVSVEKNANLPVVLPTIIEQEEIVKYLNEKCVVIDNLISQKESLVDDLEEYKKSLIYEYVTGKKEVTEEQVVSFSAIVNCKNKRFAQAVLLTKVLDEFGEYHSGRVKVAKTLYVLENHIGFDFEADPVRKVAGPLDKQYYDAEAIVRHNNWFSVSENSSSVKFFVGQDKDKYLAYYNKYFADYDSEILKIINVFKKLNTDEAELLATAYASWNDFIIKGESFSKDDIVEDILTWDDSKKRFSKEVWLEALTELEAKRLSPLGHGKITVLEKE